MDSPRALVSDPELRADFSYLLADLRANDASFFELSCFGFSPDDDDALRSTADTPMSESTLKRTRHSSLSTATKASKAAAVDHDVQSACRSADKQRLNKRVKLE